MKATDNTSMRDTSERIAASQQGRTKQGKRNASLVEQVVYGKSDAQGFDYHAQRIPEPLANAESFSETELASLGKNVLEGNRNLANETPPTSQRGKAGPMPGRDEAAHGIDQSHSNGVIGTGDNVGVRNVPGGTVRTEKPTGDPSFTPDRYAHEDPDVKVFPRGSMQLNIGESVCLQPGNDC